MGPMDFIKTISTVAPTNQGFWAALWGWISPTEAVTLAIIGAAGTWYKIFTDRKMAELRAEVDWAKADAEKDAAKAAALERKAEAIDKASQELREWLTTRVSVLEAKVDEMQHEREAYLRVAAAFFDVLDDYPDPPGPPRISAHVASYIGWTNTETKPQPPPGAPPSPGGGLSIFMPFRYGTHVRLCARNTPLFFARTPIRPRRPEQQPSPFLPTLGMA